MQRHIIIVAGGKGLRMGSDIPKQFLPVGGKPLLMRTIERFHTFDSEMPITLVLPQQHHDYWQELCDKYSFDIPHTVVHGGEERFFSVKNALTHIPDGVVVGIHDGVRPFVSHDTIEQAFAEAEKNGCAVPALPSSDSVRIADGDTSAPFDRRRVFLVQTPQCFRSEIIKEAYRAEYNPLFTDDASVVETVLKKEIRITPGNRENIKITTQFDLELANLIYNNGDCHNKGQYLERQNNQNRQTDKKILPYSETANAMGICSLAFFWFLGFIFAILGIIFAIKAKKIYAANPSMYISSTKASSGLITSTIGLSIGLFFTIAIASNF